MPDLLASKFTQLGGNLGPTAEPGLWIPQISFVTPGDLVIVYTIREGTFTRIGDRVIYDFRIAGVITFTTSAGNLLLLNLPFPVSVATLPNGNLWWGGITTTRTQLTVQPLGGSLTARFGSSQSAAAQGNITTADVPSGGTLQLAGSGHYITG